MAKGRGRFFSTKVTIKGIVFDSKIEGERYLYLLSLQKKGVITDLQLQPFFELLPKQTEEVEVQLKTKTKMVTKHLESAVTYKADFSYRKDGELIVEDVKGAKEIIGRDFPIRKKLLLYFHGIKLKVVYDATEKV